MAIESYDGLCGICARFGSADLQLRCKYELGHVGAHSWEKYREQFAIRGCTENRFYAEEKFIESVIFHKK